MANSVLDSVLAQYEKNSSSTSSQKTNISQEDRMKKYFSAILQKNEKPLKWVNVGSEDTVSLFFSLFSKIKKKMKFFFLNMFNGNLLRLRTLFKKMITIMINSE